MCKKTIYDFCCRDCGDGDRHCQPDAYEDGPAAGYEPAVSDDYHDGSRRKPGKGGERGHSSDGTGAGDGYRRGKYYKRQCGKLQHGHAGICRKYKYGFRHGQSYGAVKPAGPSGDVRYAEYAGDFHGYDGNDVRHGQL